MALSDGDWVEGEPKWWWKYVFPAKAQFWAILQTISQEPEPTPWVAALAGEVQEALAMISASTRVTDTAVGSRLKQEGFDKLHTALHTAEHGAARAGTA